MLELIVQQRFYIGAVLLFSIGLATLFLHPNLIKKIIGLNLMDTSIFLFLAAMGYVEGGQAPILTPGEEVVSMNPVPSALVLTGVVAAVSTTALFLALTCRLYRRYHSLNLDIILMRARAEREETK